jgi:hypothetical protein
MATTFDDDETSVARSRPIDLAQFDTPTRPYFNTSHNVDVAFGGNTYTAITMGIGEQQLAQDPTGREIIVTLPIAHPIVQRFCASGIPEQSVLVTLSRLQANSGAAVQFHVGFAGGISIDGHTALIRLPALTDDALKIRLPVISVQELCNHVLFDAQCTKSRADASATTPITAIVGNVIGVAIPIGQDFLFGDVIHVASGQRRSIIKEDVGTLTMRAPFVGAIVGDLVTIALGCAHDVTTCRDKFNNVVNFGGHPSVNAAIDLWSPNGLGITQQV